MLDFHSVDLILFDSKKVDYIFRSYHFIDSQFILLYFMSILFFIFFLVFLNYFMSFSFIKPICNIQSKPYECGFDPSFSSLSYKFNAYYFRVALMFLIFDLEILYLYPWVTVAKFFLVSNFFFFYYAILPIIYILFFGIVYEYVNNFSVFS